MDQRIKSVYLFSNGMVMVFNHDGEQIPDYQGRHDEVVELIAREAPETASFKSAQWRPFMSCALTREEFIKAAVSSAVKPLPQEPTP